MPTATAMPTAIPMPPGSKPPTAPAAGPESITLTKNDLQQIKNSMPRNVMQKLMPAMQAMATM
jgi:hypothetical protein